MIRTLDRRVPRWTVRPLQVGPTLRVDTTRPVDARAIIAWIQSPATLP